MPPSRTQRSPILSEYVNGPRLTDTVLRFSFQTCARIFMGSVNTTLSLALHARSTTSQPRAASLGAGSGLPFTLTEGLAHHAGTRSTSGKRTVFGVSTAIAMDSSNG